VEAEAVHHQKEAVVAAGALDLIKQIKEF